MKKGASMLLEENRILRAALQELVDYKWFSVDKDNMEFSTTITCYSLDKARKALEDVPGSTDIGLEWEGKEDDD